MGDECQGEGEESEIRGGCTSTMMELEVTPQEFLEGYSADSYDIKLTDQQRVLFVTQSYPPATQELAPNHQASNS
jgi:hypothetical protein